MADVKWIKITTNIFNDEKIQLIESMPDSDTIIVIWFKLLALAGKSNNGGLVVFNDNIPYTTDMLVTLFRRKESVIALALKTFQQFKMIEILDNEMILISNWEKHQNIDKLDEIREQNRIRKQNQRERERLLISDVTIQSRDGHSDVTQENKNKKENKNIEEDKDFLKEYSDFSSPEIIKKPVSKTFIRPSFEEVKAYCDERNNNVNPQKWFDYYSSNGWKVGKNSMKDWKAAVRTWESSDGRNSTSKPKTFEDEITARVKRMNQYMGVNVDETK